MLFPLLTILFPRDSLTICILTPFRSLSNTISTQRPLLTTLYKKAFSMIFSLECLLLPATVLVTVLYIGLLYICHATRIEAPRSPIYFHHLKQHLIHGGHLTRVFN